MRIKATVPQKFGNAETDWMWPSIPVAMGVQTPTVGAPVWVMFEGDDVERPVWVGTWRTSDLGGLPPGYSFGSVVSETSYGQAPADGTSLLAAHSDHTHGSPSLGATSTTAAPGNHTHSITFFISVKDPAYGAKGDGVTDDTAAIQAALNACLPGGVVFFPQGIYRTSAPLVIPPGVTILGVQGRRVNNLALATEVATLSYIKPLATFSGIAVLRMLDKEEGGYSADNNGQRIRHIAVDCTAISGTVDGLKATGYVHDVILDNFSVYGAPHNGVTTTSYTRLDTTSWHPYSWTIINSIVQAAGNIGWSLNSCTDTWMILVEAIGCGAQGFFLASMANSHFIGLRGEFCLDGYRITGSWGTGTGSGGGVWVACSTDRNTNYGFHIDATGNATLVFNAPLCRRDGRNGNTGGGGYAGFFVDAAICPVLVTGISVYPGVDDNGSGTNSPQYGFLASNATYVSVSSGYLHANTQGFRDGGGNTMLLRGPLVGEATGSTASPTRVTPDWWTMPLQTADQHALNISNTAANTNTPLIDISGSATGSRWLSTQVAGDTTRRYNVRVDGFTEWGPGNASRDVNLYRASAFTLKTDTNFTAAGAITTKTKSGLSVDGDFSVAPADGTVTADIKANRLSFRANGVWRYDQTYATRMYARANFR